jgi:hypothetical protein
MKQDEENCNHDNVTFIGESSLIGVYVCDDCKKEIDPKVYHQRPEFQIVFKKENQ